MGTSTTIVRQGVFTLVAISIDICGIVCLLLLSAMARNKNDVKQLKTTSLISEMETIKKQNSETTKETRKPVETNVEIKRDEWMLAVQQKIISEFYGNPIAIKPMMKSEGVGYPKIKMALDDLIEQRLVQQNGKRFKLIKNEYNN